MEILYLKRLVLDREMTVESTLHTLLVAKDFREHLPSCSMSYVSCLILLYFSTIVFDIVGVGSQREKEMTNISRVFLSLPENNDRTKYN